MNQIALRPIDYVRFLHSVRSMYVSKLCSHYRLWRPVLRSDQGYKDFNWSIIDLVYLSLHKKNFVQNLLGLHLFTFMKPQKKLFILSGVVSFMHYYKKSIYLIYELVGITQRDCLQTGSLQSYNSTLSLALATK